MIEQLDELSNWQKIGASIAFITLAMLITKYLILRPWRSIVIKSKVEWDDKMYAPVSNRIRAFVLITGIHLSVSWIYGSDEELMKDLSPFFTLIYVIITCSMASVAVAHLGPILIDRFTEKSSITVSGGNPLITFFVRMIIWFIGIYSILLLLNVELFGLMASFAVFSIIIGLAIQQTLGNIINSFMLGMDRPFEVGDRIEVEGVIGSVVSVGILSTKVLTMGETLVVIPNNKLIQSTVINHARGGGDGKARRISVLIDIGVDYNESTDHVKYSLLSVARECPFGKGDPEPGVLLIELGEHSKVFRLYFWLDDYSEEWVARDWLLRAIDERFVEEGIKIPYPIVELQGSMDDQKDDELVEQREFQKSARQRIARINMTREEKKLREERQNAKDELEWINKRLKRADLSNRDRTSLERDARELERALTVFGADDD